MPEFSKVEIGADVLSVLVAIADQECDRLHDMVDETAHHDAGDPIAVQEHIDYVERAEEALQAILVARQVLDTINAPTEGA